MFVRFRAVVTVARTAVFALPVGLFFAAAAAPAQGGSVLATASATPGALLADVVPRARLPWASGVEAASIEVALILAPLAGRCWAGSDRRSPPPPPRSGS